VNGPEILHLIRRDLKRAVTRLGKPPTPRPMDASPWVAMSALLTRTSAWQAKRPSGSRPWRWGAGVIAPRSAANGQSPSIVAQLSRAPKRRTADDLLMACELHPAYAKARAELPHLTTRNLIAVATGEGSVPERALALWYALGTDRRRSVLVSRRGEPQLVFDYLCEAGWPHSIVEVAREGFRRTGALVALLSCELHESTRVESDRVPPETMIVDVPSSALDLYSREGRAALTRFLIQTRLPPDGCALASNRRAALPSWGISCFGSKAGLSRIECAGRRRTSFVVKLIASALVPSASTPPKSSADASRPTAARLSEARAAVAGSFHQQGS
jgi:hypothetical protein